MKYTNPLIRAILVRATVLGLFVSAPSVGCSQETTAPQNDNPLTVIGNFTVVDTGQDECYDDQDIFACPVAGDPFYGQDSQYNGIVYNYVDNADGTISDLNTGLMWQKSPELYNKKFYDDAAAEADTFSLAGYDDWRLPSVKELYSLMDFRGSSFELIPYLDTDYFDFRFGDESLGERVIDGQYWSSSEYVGRTMNNDETVFGVNFADGRIKGYPRYGNGGEQNKRFVRYVRGNAEYGDNNFVDNDDGTITDLATGLMWQKTDDGTTRNWEEALTYAESRTLADQSDWRLPNVKELQSIVDYTRAPDAVNPAQIGPAIDPIFGITEIESYFWSSTTLHEAPPMLGFGGHAAYIAFGQCWGYMFGQWINVHGAGAQRSDPKSGDPADYPYGFGPQGDDIRIYNYVRCVRDANDAAAIDPPEDSDGDDLNAGTKTQLALSAYPNPTAGSAKIKWSNPSDTNQKLEIFDISGRCINTLTSGPVNSGTHLVSWNGKDIAGHLQPNGVYLARLISNTDVAVSSCQIILRR